MEKTRHYLLLREKLEATLQAGQDALYKSSDICDFAKSPVLCSSPSSSPAPDSPNQRQRELAAKVTAKAYICPLFCFGLYASCYLTNGVSTVFYPVSAPADAHIQQRVQPGEQQCQ